MIRILAMAAKAARKGRYYAKTGVAAQFG